VPADEDLVAAARAGDSGALERLLERHQAQVYRFGMRMCGNPEDAKDVLQETLLAMARGVTDFRGASSVSTWLYSIARSYCIKKRRRSKFAPEERSLDSDVTAEARVLADPARSPEEAVLGKELLHALGDAIASIDPTYREVLELRDVEGLSAAEVAEVLGLSVQAVKSRLHRARLSVRARLAPLLGGEQAPAPGNATGCPDVLTLFSQHLEDEVRPDVCAEMERHLDDCDRCRGACETLKTTLALCKTAPPSEVPLAVQDSVRTAVRQMLAGATPVRPVNEPMGRP